MGRKNNGGAGFTLVELVIVLVIIAILIIIVISFLRSQTFKANDAKRKADLNRIVVVAEEYEKDHNCYPPPSLVTCTPGTGLQPYLEAIPCDPVTKKSYYYDVDITSSCAGWFRVYSSLQNTADPQAQTKCGPGGIYNFYEGSANALACQYIQKPGGAYGCKNGACVPLSWDNTRQVWECYPIYGQSDCGSACLTGKCTPKK